MTKCFRKLGHFFRKKKQKKAHCIFFDLFSKIKKKCKKDVLGKRHNNGTSFPIVIFLNQKENFYDEKN